MRFPNDPTAGRQRRAAQGPSSTVPAQIEVAFGAELRIGRVVWRRTARRGAGSFRIPSKEFRSRQLGALLPANASAPRREILNIWRYRRDKYRCTRIGRAATRTCSPVGFPDGGVMVDGGLKLAPAAVTVSFQVMPSVWWTRRSARRGAVHHVCGPVVTPGMAELDSSLLTHLAHRRGLSPPWRQLDRHLINSPAQHSTYRSVDPNLIRPVNSALTKRN